MKNLTKFFTVFVSVLMMACTLWSCGSDDDDAEPGPIADPATIVAGTYVGTGKLGIAGVSGVTGETYSGMKISVTRSSNEYVIVNPYYADGKPFFSSENGSVYQISQMANGDFRLSNSNAPLAQLTITKSGHMEYEYPYVKVGNESGYSLIFTGDKQN